MYNFLLNASTIENTFIRSIFIKLLGSKVSQLFRRLKEKKILTGSKIENKPIISKFVSFFFLSV